jgi:pimeloyl-ACP methyl ester carboxylesterase
MIWANNMYENKITIPNYMNFRLLQKVESHSLNYVEFGDKNNNEVLICSHALLRNCRDFDKVARTLSNKFRIIAFDVAGRGKSDWLNDAACYNHDTYVQDAILLLKELDIKKVHWLGTSMGGLIGMVIAALHGNMIHSLILNDVGPFVPGKAMAKILKYVPLAPAFTNLDEVKKHFKKIYANFGIDEEEDWDHLTHNSVTRYNDGLYRMSYDPAIAINFNVNKEYVEDIDLWPLWHMIQCPVFVIRGEESEILNRSTLEAMARKKNVEFCEISAVGHAPSLTTTEQINLIDNWLTKVIEKYDTTY